MKAYSVTGLAVGMLALQALAGCDLVDRVSPITKTLCGIVPVAADVIEATTGYPTATPEAIAKILCDAWEAATTAPAAVRGGVAVRRLPPVGTVRTIVVRGKRVQVQYVGRG